jgi:hypothetical protein
MYSKRYKIINKILKNYKEGMGIYKSCQVTGICYGTFMYWLRQEKRLHNVFERMKQDKTELVEDSLFTQAIKGDVPAIKFYLTNRGTNWKEKPEVSVENHTHYVVVRNQKEFEESQNAEREASKT